MKKTILTLSLCAFALTLSAQDISQFKEVPTTEGVNSAEYIKGNKYQKDAILFVDMLSATHPYYIKEERRAVLQSRLEGLVAECGSCTSDSLFVELLREVMKEVRDKHTDVLDIESFKRLKAPKDKISGEASDTAQKSSSPLEKNNKLFSYSIFEKESICYLQFNQCNDARTLRNDTLPRFDKMLDEMFAEMKLKNTGTLIVDVQYNNGGSSRLCDELIDRIYPFSKVRNLDAYLRFSPLLALYSPKTEAVMKAWEEAGNKDELYPMPQKKAQVPEHEYFQGKVVFIQGPKTFSSAGILVTTARDNSIGTIIGTESSYSPSHYGEVLPFKLPNTGILGSVCTKYFERADKTCTEDRTLVPDIFIDLDNKDAAWKEILSIFGHAK
ncbi:MAG: S41 family peptidase [Candidatus Cryptobacteroides sp.]